MSEFNLHGMREYDVLDKGLGPVASRRSWGAYRLLFKPVFDGLFAVGAILFFSPFMLLTALVIFLQDRGPIFIVQNRIGFAGRKFGCIKFRTMAVDADKQLERLLAESPEARAEWATRHKLRNDPRVTRIGAFLRTTSLDELPQFFNILLGQMSVVGPRPIVDDEVHKYGRDFRYYTAVKPGISGLWQVSGRSDTSYEERVRLDVSYVKALSFANDVRIILKTIGVVLNGRGAY